LSINESIKESSPYYDEYVDLEGARIWTATQGSGEALVLLHGGPGGHDQVGPVAEMLDDLVLVHRYEQRSSGRSAGNPPYTVERWLDDLERLRVHWGHDVWIIAGHSFGAELALAYAAAFPKRARAVIYMSCLPAVSANRRGEEEFRANRAARIPQALQTRFVELRRLRDESGEEWTPTLATELSGIGLSAEFGDPATASRHIATMIEGAPPVNREVNVTLGEDFFHYANNDKFLTSLRQMERQVLILHGERDLRPMWAVERLVEQLPNARLVRLPGGHFPWLEAPAELRRALRTFVSEIVSTNQDVNLQSQHL
jgi:proline iminopeptidase